jgi:aminoglycoside phosphotransferase (APT) family kinase protein
MHNTVPALRKSAKVRKLSRLLHYLITYSSSKGSYNKIFLLELDNGVKVTARIPGPVVGNLELSVASEVATMAYLRDSRAANVPKVLSWCASEANPVKWPYILTEYVPGIPLQQIWAKIRGVPTAEALGLIMGNSFDF